MTDQKVLAEILAPAFVDELESALPHLNTTKSIPWSARRTLSLCLRFLYQSGSLDETQTAFVKKVVLRFIANSGRASTKQRAAIAELMLQVTILRRDLNKALDALESGSTEPVDPVLQAKMQRLTIAELSKTFQRDRIQSTICDRVELHPEVSKAFFNCGARMVTHSWGEDGNLRIHIEALKSQEAFFDEFYSKHPTIQLNGERTVSPDQVMKFVKYTELDEEPILVND